MKIEIDIGKHVKEAKKVVESLIKMAEGTKITIETDGEEE